jgi:hypothetical protein
MLTSLCTEPTNGAVVRVTESASLYTAVEQVWNDTNLFINTRWDIPPPSLSYTLNDTQTWEFLFDLPEQTVATDDAEAVDPDMALAGVQDGSVGEGLGASQPTGPVVISGDGDEEAKEVCHCGLYTAL